MTAGLNAIEKALLKIIEKHPGGIRKEALIDASGWTSYHCSKALRSLRAMGLAAPTLGGNKLSAWATTANIVLIVAEFERVADAARLAREQRKLAALARAAAAPNKERDRLEEADAVEAFARPSIHNVVAVGKWERPQIPGPSSIFNLTKEAA